MPAAPPDSSVLDQFAELDSATVSDALESLSLPGGQGGIHAMWGTAKLVGFAVTAALAPLGDGAPQGGSHILTGAVAEAGPDHVIVVANQGRTDVSCWGGLLSLGASLRGIRGVIADGACRDLDQARQLGFPVYAKATTPVTARGRLQQVCTNEPIRICSASVHPGDLMLADSTGVVVVPHDQVHSVLHAAQALMVRENTIAHELRAGRSLPQAMLDSRLARTGTQP